MPRSKINKHNFTLVEILVAMAVFMIAMAPLMGLLMRTTATHTNNIKRIKSQMLAKDELARFTQYKLESFTNFNNATNKSKFTTSGDIRQHTRYNGLAYKSDISIIKTDLVLFSLEISYTKSWNIDESYQLYISREAL
jgi:Tfp pilus assembly protein PilV